MIKTCETCGEALDPGHKLFCSEECVRKFFDERVRTVICPTCGCSFDTWHSLIYCSSTCAEGEKDCLSVGLQSKYGS
jgi:hypothetical protein